MLIESCITRVTHSVHGGFVADSRQVEAILERMLGDVNYTRRSVAAFVSEMTSINYFDCDFVTLAIVMASLRVEPTTLTDYMAFTSDERISEIFRDYAPTDYYN